MKIYRYPLYGSAGTTAAFALNRIVEHQWTLPVLAVAVVLNLLALVWNASRWRGYKPVCFGLVGAILIVLGGLTPGANDMILIGVAFLIAISLWAAWPPKNPGEKPPCCL